MSEEVFTSAGTKIYVGTLPKTYDQSSMEAVEYTEIGEVTDLGEFGKVYSVVTHNPLGDRKTVKRKGSYNEGSVNMQMARVPSDDGHDILLDALDSDDSYAFKIVLQDTTEIYFSAQVVSYTTNIGSVDNIVHASCLLEIDDDIIEVAPVES